jgi:hypothetical protein
MAIKEPFESLDESRRNKSLSNLSEENQEWSLHIVIQ